MIVVGLTGSYASGKTETAGMLAKLGAKIFDADLCARDFLKEGGAGAMAVGEIFGRQYLLKNGAVDRKKLARRVFARKQDLKKLNALIHPAVFLEMLETVKKNQRKKGVLVLDVPLLFEARVDRMIDCSVVITSSRKHIMHRAARRGQSPVMARRILSSQWPDKKKIARADYVIENNGSLAELKKKVAAVYHQIRESCQGCRPSTRRWAWPKFHLS